MPSVKPGSKYFPLYRHLKRQRGDRIPMTFSEVEVVLGAALPRSARRSRAFWSNRARGGLQAEAWLEAGYEAVEVEVRARRVVFQRPSQRYVVRKEAGLIRLAGGLDPAF